MAKKAIRKVTKRQDPVKIMLSSFKKVDSSRSKSSKPISSKKPVTRPSKPAPKKKLSYKELYIKSLEKSVKGLKKDVKSIKDTLSKKPEKPIQWSGSKKGTKPPPAGEAFPADEDYMDLPKTQKEAVAMIAEIKRQINQRNIMLAELMDSPGKLY